MPAADSHGELRRLPAPCLVVLIGPAGAGKSTWAAQHFAPTEVVSSDRLRAVVGHGEDDLDATDEAFGLLDQIVDARLRRRLTTVVDTLGLDPDRRRSYRERAAAHGVPCVAVGFDVAAEAARARNRHRARPLPADAVTRQVRAWRETRDRLDDEGFHVVLRAEPVRLVAEHLRSSAELAAAQRARPASLRFGLHVSSFAWPDGREGLSARLGAVARAAEDAGFDSVWVMDHVRQIPQVGRDWDPMLECTTTLAWLAAATERVRVGSLVSPMTFRPVPVFGKAMATIDVLSEGRLTCGVGLGWYEREHAGYGLDLPPLDQRYALLDDALALLPRLWGPGAKPFAGRVLSVPETICYPRPLQDPVPLLVGGSGERRTLRLAARHAHACNLFGDAATVARKVAALRAHVADAARDHADVEVTHLSTSLLGASRAHVDELTERLRPRRANPARFAASVNAGTVDDHVGRFRELADAGVELAIVSLPDLATTEPVERFGAVIGAFDR